MQVNALEIRNSFGGVLKKLQKYDEPIIIEKNRTPVAVLISIESFKNRFVDYREVQKKRELLDRFQKNLVKCKKNSTLELRSLRND